MDDAPAAEDAVDNSKTAPSPLSNRNGITDAVRVQILSAEHYSLLATRTITWNEMFTRATMFITVVSAAVVALALVAQATGFGQGFRLFALLVLPVVFLVGLVTFIRLGEANTDDIRMVIGMNRLRHAYLELAPELKPYFITAHNDDFASILLSYGQGLRPSLLRFLGGTPALVGVINSVVFGVIAALIGEALRAPVSANVIIGVAAALAAAFAQGVMVYRAAKSGRSGYRPLFPG